MIWNTEKARAAAEWHLWELRDDAKSFLTMADEALRRDKVL